MLYNMTLVFLIAIGMSTLFGCSPFVNPQRAEPAQLVEQRVVEKNGRAEIVDMPFNDLPDAPGMVTAYAVRITHTNGVVRYILADLPVETSSEIFRRGMLVPMYLTNTLDNVKYVKVRSMDESSPLIQSADLLRVILPADVMQTVFVLSSEVPQSVGWVEGGVRGLQEALRSIGIVRLAAFGWIIDGVSVWYLVFLGPGESACDFNKLMMVVSSGSSRTNWLDAVEEWPDCSASSVVGAAAMSVPDSTTMYVWSRE